MLRLTLGLGSPAVWVRIHRLMDMKDLLALGVLVAGVVFCLGCEKPLFPANLPRTPYERYQQLHGQGRAGMEENAYGGQKPALRERLRPLGSP